MAKKYAVLLPQGDVATEVDDVKIALLELATRCCEDVPCIISNLSRDMNTYLELLRVRESESHAPPARVVVILTDTRHIGTILQVRRRLTSYFSHFERALWAVFVEKPTPFRGGAVLHGELSADLDGCPVWTTKDDGVFMVLTPRTSRPLFELNAREHWRLVDPPPNGMYSSRSSTGRMVAVNPLAPSPSRHASVRMPAVVLPSSEDPVWDPKTKKP